MRLISSMYQENFARHDENKEFAFSELIFIYITDILIFEVVDEKL